MRWRGVRTRNLNDCLPGPDLIFESESSIGFAFKALQSHKLSDSLRAFIIEARRSGDHLRIIRDGVLLVVCSFKINYFWWT
jgi:hypothetical protein